MLFDVSEELVVKSPVCSGFFSSINRVWKKIIDLELVDALKPKLKQIMLFTQLLLTSGTSGLAFSYRN